MDEQKKTILEFLKTQLLGVIATVDSVSNKPESALVAFSETDHLELIFGTLNDTRKFANLQHNPHVAFVITGGEITVQYEGVARLAGTPEETDEYRTIHLTKNPAAKKFAHLAQQQFFKVRPTWIRYSNFSIKPPSVFAVTV